MDKNTKLNFHFSVHFVRFTDGILKRKIVTSERLRIVIKQKKLVIFKILRIHLFQKHLF